MSRKFPRRRVGAAAAALALASLGGLDFTLVTSRGAPAREPAAPVAAEVTPAASSQVLPSPPQASPTAVPSAPLTTVPAPPAPSVAAKPPPVVDGVKRTNVGSAHSPQIQQQLSAAPVTMPAPIEAGAVGVDVADYQHPGGAAIDWPQVAAAGYKFAFIKATEGDYYVNTASTSPSQPGYARESAAAEAAGLYVMPYAFANPYPGNGTSAHPSDGSGTCQADYAWRAIAAASPAYTSSALSLPVVLDIEQDPYVATQASNANQCYGRSPAAMATWIGDFLTEMTADSGKPPIVYTNPTFWSQCVGGRASFTTSAGAAGSFRSYPLWIANYGTRSPEVPAAWDGQATFWQFTSAGQTAGEAGTVDEDYLMPLAQSSTRGIAVSPAQVRSLSALNGQSVSYAATGLPPGLTMSPSGLITGTPSADGSFTVQVTPSAGAVLSLRWTVSAMTVVATAQRTTAGSPAQHTVKVIDASRGSPGFALKFSATGLPTGLSVNAATGTMSGWAAVPGTFHVKVAASDGLGASAAASFTWTVRAAAERGPAGEIRQFGGTDLCLQVPGSRTAFATSLDLARCTRKANQVFTAAPDGTLRVLGHCLAAGGPHVLLYPCNGSIADQWVPGSFGSLVDVRYGTCLNVASAAARAGTRPTLASCQGSSRQASQHWSRPLVPMVSGVGGLCVGEVGDTAELRGCASVPGQRWLPSAPGTFAVQIATSCLAEHTAAGSALSIAPCDGAAPAQQWRLVRAGRVATELRNPATGQCATVSARATVGSKLVLGTCTSSLAGTFRVS